MRKTRGRSVAAVDEGESPGAPPPAESPSAVAALPPESASAVSQHRGVAVPEKGAVGPPAIGEAHHHRDPQLRNQGRGRSEAGVPSTRKVFSEDLVYRIGNEAILGIVTRTWHDSDAEDDVHEDGDEEDVTKGPIPLEHVVVSWYTGTGKPELVFEDELVVLDRSLMYGDVVKDPQDESQSGTVINISMTVDLQHVTTGKVVKNVDTRSLRYYRRFVEGNSIVWDDWLGVIDDVFDKVLLKFPNGSICMAVVEDDLQSTTDWDRDSYFYSQRYSVGQKVRDDPHNLQQARWFRGGYEEGQTEGTVIAATDDSIVVHWKTYRHADKLPEGHELPPEPEDVITEYNEDIKFDSFAEHASFQLSDHVVFRDEEDAKAHGIDVRIGEEHLAKGDYDSGCMAIIRSETRLDVRWQDNSVSRGVLARDLYPYLNMDDQDVWPLDFVVRKGEDITNPDLPAAKQTGLVQSVNAAHRTCVVKWFAKDEYKLLEPAEELSFYEVAAHEYFQFRLYDRVLITDTPYQYPSDWAVSSSELQEPSEPVEGEFFNGRLGPDWRNWTGEICDIHFDGTISVRFLSGVTARVPACRLVIVSDEDDEDDVSQASWETMSAEYETDGVAEEGEEQAGDDQDMEFLGDDEHVNGFAEAVAEDVDMEEEVPAGFPVGEEMLAHGTDSAEREEPKPPASVDVSNGLTPFKMLEEAPQEHQFYNNTIKPSPAYVKRVNKEFAILEGNLPPGIFVRVFEDRVDLLRVLISGPENTPYEGGLFLFDVQFPADFPRTPPVLHFHSWTGGIGRANPNLYEDGKVCLSLLNTWHGHGSESWRQSSTLLQVLISVQSLILVAEPYYNEAGFEKFVGTDEAAVNSPVYTEKAYMLSLRSINHILANPPRPFESEVDRWYFAEGMLRRVLERARAVVARSEESPQIRLGTREHIGVVQSVSTGALKLTKSFVRSLEEKASRHAL